MTWYKDLKAELGELSGAALAVATPPQIRPTASIVEPELQQLEAKEYRRVTQSLGMVPPILQKQELLVALKELDIPIYPFEAVRLYMNALHKSTHRSWFWRPLRSASQDRTGLPSWGSMSAPEINGGGVLGGRYEATVPMAVLLVAEKIALRVPNVGFFVSDAPNESDVKDPFLAVSLPGLNEMFVVEVWDEAGFKR